jgi:hypothetical protein
MLVKLVPEVLIKLFLDGAARTADLVGLYALFEKLASLPAG